MKRLSNKSPTVEKCFCCIDLRTAGIVLGIFCVLWSFWPTVLVCVIALPGHICWFFGIFKVWGNINKFILNSKGVKSAFDVNTLFVYNSRKCQNCCWLVAHFMLASTVFRFMHRCTLQWTWDMILELQYFLELLHFVSFMLFYKLYWLQSNEMLWIFQVSCSTAWH